MQLTTEIREYFPKIKKQPVRMPKCNKEATARRKRIEELQERKKLKKDFEW